MKQFSLKEKLKYPFIASLLFALIMLAVMFFNLKSTAKESSKFHKALSTITSVENIAVYLKNIDDKTHILAPKDKIALNKLYNSEIKKVNEEKKKLLEKNLTISNNKLDTFFQLVTTKTSAFERTLKIVENLKKDTIIYAALAENNQTYLQNIIQKRNEIISEQRNILNSTNLDRDKYAKQLAWILFTLALSFFFIVINGYILISQDFKKSEKINENLRYNYTLLSNISDAVITVDEKNNIKSWNKYAEELYGYSESDVLGKPVANIIKIDEKEKQLFDEAVKNKYTWKGEMLHYKKDGNPLNVEVSTSAIYDEKNKYTGGIGVIHNVSKRVKLEAELNQLTEKLKKDINLKSNDLNNFFDRIADAFFIIDNNWNYVYLNKSALTYHNKTESELIGKNIWALNPALLDGAFYNCLLEAKRTQQPIRKQFYYAQQDKWFEDLIYPDKDGISVYYNEITTNKKADLILKNTLDKLSFHITNTPLAIIEFDSSLNILQWSTKAEEIFGWTEDDVIEQKLKIDKLLFKDDLPSFFDSLNDTASKSKKTETILFRGYTKKGDLIYCEWYNSFLKNENNNEGVMLSLVKNVTENKKIEIELKNAELKFRSLVEDSLVGVYIRKGERFLYANPRFANIFGYTLDELYSNVASINLIKQADIEKIVQARKIQKDKVIQYEFEGIKKNGDLFYAELFGNTTILDGEEVIIGTVIDITEKKKATEQLKLSELAVKESNEIFEMVAQATQDGIWSWEMETDVLSGNEVFLGFFNKPKDTKLKFEDFLARVHNDDKERLNHNFKTALKNKENILTENFRFLTETGNYKNILDRAYLLYDDKKRAYRMVGAMQDITTMKNAEHKILKEKELSESTINSLPGIFFIANKAGNIYLWNKNFENITGFTVGELKTLKPMDLIFEEDKEMMVKRVKNVFATGTDSVEAFFVNKKGDKMPYYFTGTLINYENEPCLLGIGIDISEKVNSQQELIKSEEKYRVLFNENPVPMWILSEDRGIFLDANKAATFTYGYTKEEFLTGPIINLHPENDIAYEKWRERTDENKYNEMFWLHQKKDGTIINVHIVSNRFMYNGIETTLAMANDITNQVLAEEKLQTSNEAFRSLASKLEEVRESERTHMAREIHDELGQQLTGLKMDISWINKKVQSTDEAVKQKMKETIQLIDKTVITVRRIATELRPSILDDLGLIAAMDWQSEEFEKRHEIISTFTTNVNHLLVNTEIATGVFRIFQESLTNVARHSGATKVISTFNFNNNCINLTIVDNGKGFNEEEVLKKKTLGLLGMKERVLLINGTYQIKGNEGKGTSVIISVPLN
jgi:PAS domain S-box-containing protein